MGWAGEDPKDWKQRKAKGANCIVLVFIEYTTTEDWEEGKNPPPPPNYMEKARKIGAGGPKIPMTQLK